MFFCASITHACGALAIKLQLIQCLRAQGLVHEQLFRVCMGSRMLPTLLLQSLSLKLKS